MKASAISSDLLFASTAFAGCYSGGQPWPANEERAVESVAEQHNGNSHPPGAEQAIQVPIDGVYIKFIHENISDTGHTIYEAEAYSDFNKEFTGCEYGVDTSYTDWRYV